MEFLHGNIAVIAPEEPDASCLIQLLASQGHNCHRINADQCTGETGMEPDCFIIDMNDYHLSLQICGSIMSEPLLAGVPVILLNSSNSPENVISCFDAGAADYIVKPFTGRELLARVNNHISMRYMKKRLEEMVDERTSELTEINRILRENVEEHKKVLKDLQDNETLLLAIALHMPNSYLAIIEKNYTIGFASGQEFKKSGFDSWRLLGIPLEKLYGERYPEIKEKFESTFAGKALSFEFFFNNQHQYYRTVPLPAVSGEISRILVVAENITERKEAENRIRESLHEKETLLKEIHHRVKNNLQIVSSLLNIHIHNTGSPELKDTLKGIQGRIFSMALVHEKMYRYKNFSRINFRDYLVDLASEIRSLFGGPGAAGRIAISMELDDESLTIEKAIPCGLIMNELIMNSYKHAFREREGGGIRISFKKTDEASSTMTVADNGPGMPDNFSIADSDSMGMLIVRELVNQISGRVRVYNDDGAVVEVAFGGERPSGSNVLSESGRRGKRILIVEDERIISKMICRIIDDGGYTIVGCVSSGRDAIDQAREKKPDLVVMDILLEDDIDGIEAAGIITAESNCKIIFLTGNSDTVTISQARNVQPCDILTKPVQKHQLLQALHGAFASN